MDRERSGTKSGVCRSDFNEYADFAGHRQQTWLHFPAFTSEIAPWYRDFLATSEPWGAWTQSVAGWPLTKWGTPEQKADRRNLFWERQKYENGERLSSLRPSQTRLSHLHADQKMSSLEFQTPHDFAQSPKVCCSNTCDSQNLADSAKFLESKGIRLAAPQSETIAVKAYATITWGRSSIG